MLIDPFFNQSPAGVNQSPAASLSFTRRQASRFAKEVADDFNPLHNEDAKRFCVPGDLLFAVVLALYGASRHMRFTFSGMVTEETVLTLPPDTSPLVLAGGNGREYLRVERSGDTSREQALIDNLTRSYVTFSGRTFPHVLIPLMRDKQVMINPDRPMVMYESMLIDLLRMDVAELDLELDRAKTGLTVNGKRGSVCLAFNLTAGNEIVGRGEKHMVLSGLRPFDQAAVDQVIAEYNAWKQQYQAEAAPT